MHTYIFFYNVLLENISRDVSEIPRLGTIPELCNMNSLPHTGRFLPQACAYVLVCFYGQHIEEPNVAEMLW